jgi:outer membrane protein assembly factor BamA
MALSGHFSASNRPRSGVGPVPAIRGAFFALLLAASPLLMARIAWPAEAASLFRLASVSVVGSTRYPSQEIAKASGLKVAADVTPDDLRAAANRLASIGVFAQVDYRYETRGDSITVVFTVLDAPKVFPCTFENFVWFSRQDLLNDLRARVALFDGSVPPGGEMQDLVSAGLRAMLEARGLNAQVEATPEGQMGGPVQGIQFRETGVPVPVRRVEFTGVHEIDASLLQKAAEPLLEKDYDASFIRDYARQSISAVYRQRGYLRAKFGDPVPHLLPHDPTPNAVEVAIPVSEGEAYTLAGMIFSGESAIPDDELKKSIHVNVGKPLDAVELDQDVYALVMLFHPKGYIMADAAWKPVLNDAAHTAICQIQIRQGDLYRLGKFEIAGLDESLAKSLERLSRLRPGDPYNANYWSKFIAEVSQRLPPAPSGWKLNPQQTIHNDTKTVDVQLIFARAISH